MLRLSLPAFALAAIALTVPARAVEPTDADRSLAQGDFTRAETLYRAAVAGDPNDAHALLGLGTMELYRNDLADARRDIGRSLQLKPGDPVATARMRTLDERTDAPGAFAVSMSGAQARIPLIRIDPLPMVRARINGHDALLFLDTGATTIDLSEDAARNFGVNLQAAPGSGVFAGGLTARVMTGTISTAEFPGLTVRAIATHVLAGPMEIDGTRVDGAIGTTFLAHFLSTIDYARGTLILQPRSAQLPAGTQVPMWLVGDHFLFARGSINGAPDALLNVDTGGAGIGVQLTKTALAAAGIVPDASHAQSFHGGGGDARVLPFTAGTVRLGDVSEHDVPGVFFPDGDQYRIFPFAVAGTISHAFFRTTALTFDFNGMRMIVDAGS